jgi:hypothetical protein
MGFTPSVSGLPQTGISAQLSTLSPYSSERQHDIPPSVCYLKAIFMSLQLQSRRAADR